MSSSLLAERVRSAGVLPIIIPGSHDWCIAAIEALTQGGARGIEIVLRSPAALPAIGSVRRRFPELLLAAGTVLSQEQYLAAVDAGADLCISPGLDPIMLELAGQGPVPLVPGVQTASEVMAARRAGLRLLKFYPAEPAGGTTVLRDYASVFPDVVFMPSGKIDAQTLPGYASLRNVASVGGSWMHAEAGEPLPLATMTERMRAALAIMDQRDGVV